MRGSRSELVHSEPAAPSACRRTVCWHSRQVGSSVSPHYQPVRSEVTVRRPGGVLVRRGEHLTHPIAISHPMSTSVPRQVDLTASDYNRPAVLDAFFGGWERR